MGKIIRIGEEYYVEFFARGLRYRKAGGRSEKEAQKLLDDIEGKIEQGEMAICIPEIQIDQFLDAFLKKIQKTHSPRTCSRYESAAGHFNDYCRRALSGDAKLSEVTPRIIEAYRAQLIKANTGPKLINFTVLLLRNILDQSINEGYLNDNPTFHTQFVPSPRGIIPRTLTDQEWERVCSRAPDTIKNVLTALRNTGMRPEELCALKWSNVDLDENCIKIRRQIPMDGHFLEIIRRLNKKGRGGQEFVFLNDDGLPWTKESLTKVLHPNAAEIKLSAVHFLSIVRNMFVKDVLSKGVPLTGLHRLLGLNDIAKVMRFAGLMRSEK